MALKRIVSVLTILVLVFGCVAAAGNVFTPEPAGCVNFEEAEFTLLIEKKAGLIQKIEEFDNGFQSIYNRVAEELKVYKNIYKEQILEMQGLITRITDLGVKLSTLEEKNKMILEPKLKEKRQGIRQFKVSKQTADKYYRNMIGMQTGASYFMDQKK